MNIKSLLLGSAAALVAVSGARAADAVTVAEPEPAEYVKICDVYGSGYFYIPGTETCLRVGGYVRYDATLGNDNSIDGTTTTDRLDGSLNNTWHKNARFELKTWTGQETELGTLKTYTESRFEFGNSNGFSASAGNKSAKLVYAWMQLGGLRVGLDDSLYASLSNYGGSAIQDSAIPYGDQASTNLISYVFDAGNGLSAGVSLEEGSGFADTIDSYVPHIVAGAKYTQGWGAISGVVAYNSNWEEWAGKIRVDVNATDQLSLFVMAGYGSDGNSAVNFYKPWNGKWAIWGGASFKANEKATIFGEVQYAAGNTGDWGPSDGSQLVVSAGVAYQVVPGLTVTPEIDYNKFEGSDAGVGGWLRFQRSF